ncbi:MAG: DUF938 domain-containing protein [Gammaproteobacteria bacterium]
MLTISDAAERNKQPILDVLQQWLADRPCTVLEVGSGTGQHAAHFARHLPHLVWQPSDFGRYLPLVQEFVAHTPLPNLRPPLELDVNAFGPVQPIDVIYSANTLHIMSWASACTFLREAGQRLVVGGWLIVYGPFRVGGRATSEGNARFDAMLQAEDPRMGVRDREQICVEADKAGLSLRDIRQMPANNQLLRFERRLTPSP